MDQYRMGINGIDASAKAGQASEELPERIRCDAGSLVPERIRALRELMKAEGIDACIVPTGDPHMSEYISDHYKTREFITGFTGSAGTAVITAESAGLWTDSRYFLQAEAELAGSGIELFRQGLAETPSVMDHLKEHLPGGSTVCVDGRLVSAAWAKRFRKELGGQDPAAGISLRTDLDLAGAVWDGRPVLEFHEVYDYPLKYAGVSRTEKIAQIRGDIAAAGADILVLSGLSDIAWILNLRGSDIQCNPVFFSFAVISRDRAILFADPSALPSDLIDTLGADGIVVAPYDSFYGALGRIDAFTDAPDGSIRVMLDKGTCSERIVQAIPEGCQLVFRDSPVMLRKCIKNPVEMAGVRSAHLKDGIAMCRFIHWLKTNVQSADAASDPDSPDGGAITEISAGEKLHEFRSRQDLFCGDSFEPIVGYGPHGAIVHYSATEESDPPLYGEGLVLIDSGGQYLDGTTDVTRTIVLGPLTEWEKECFTAVLRGHIDLARTRFPYGLNGAHLDYLAHAPLWEMGLDYGHGTGHGVGHFLNVHEDPNRISWRVNPAGAGMPAFEEGMLTSDEPGYYEAGQFGIRHEGLLLCVEDGESEHGRFMRFEEVTLVPFDLEGVLPERMQEDEIAYLNAYHEMVYQKIAPHLDEAERAWLREATRAITK